MADPLLQLAESFYPELADLGRFELLPASELPPVYRKLLAHEHHMTVTVEAHHEGPVDLRVLEVRATPTDYARVIVLIRRRDSQVVQFGIVRIHWHAVAVEVRARIEREDQPLGRILIDSGVLRTIHPLAYYRVTCGPVLQACLGVDLAYGRAARIDCDGQAAIELLEIVP